MTAIAERVFLVTGATDGIGRATAHALAGQGATVLLHGRSEAKLAAVSASIRTETGSDDLHTFVADFASLAAVAGLADEVVDRFPNLNVLVNNAGHITDHWQLSADGYELTFAVNYLAPVLLTLRLLGTLEASTPARIVNVSSTALGGGVPDLGNRQQEESFSGWQAYANTKLMNAMFSQSLAVKLADTGVISNALCPGLIDTNFFHTNNVFGGGQYERLRPGMRPPEEGAAVPLYLAADAAAAGVNGKFFIREGRDGRRPVELGLDARSNEQLWSATLDLLQMYGV